MQDLTVKLTNHTVKYQADIAGFGDHLAQGGKVLPLVAAQADAKAFFRANHSPIIKAATYWVTLDESGLAYRVDVDRRGHHRILAASPMPGPNNVKDVYVA